jgi:hypothetical protein
MPTNDHDYDDLVDRVLAELETLGQARIDEVAAGGEAWAAFGDWCHIEGVPRTTAALNRWLEERKKPLSEKALQRITHLIAQTHA